MEGLVVGENKGVCVWDGEVSEVSVLLVSGVVSLSVPFFLYSHISIQIPIITTSAINPIFFQLMESELFNEFPSVFIDWLDRILIFSSTGGVLLGSGVLGNVFLVSS